MKIGLDDKASPAMKKTQKNSETLANKIKVMSSRVEDAQKSVDKLTKEFNESVKKTGAASKETRELAEKLDDAEKEAKQAENALDKYNKELDDTGEKAEKSSKGLSNFASKLGKGLKVAAKIGTAAMSAAAAGVIALTKQSLESYAEYEQLVGGAELMFGKAFETVKKNAQEAYKTVQMSQNEYLTQVNSFATGLKTSLGGNEQAAADLAHKIIKAEADIIAATGNTAENVQNAFNGIMRSNFTMLDNLQIGITPTKEGFQELIDKVNAWNATNGKATKYQMGNLADMQSALVDYIDMVGYSGYAQDEAARTIQGSLASAQAAWSNLVTGLSDKEADIGSLVSNFISSVSTVGQRILPIVKEALSGIVSLIQSLVPEIINILPSIIRDVLPQLAKAVVEVVKALVSAISDNKDLLVDSFFSVAKFLAENVWGLLPDLLSLALDLIISLALGIGENLAEMIPIVTDALFKVIDALTNPEVLSRLLDAALALVLALVTGLVDSIGPVISAVFLIVENIHATLLQPSTIGMLIEAAVQLVIALVVGIVKALPQLLSAVWGLVENIFTIFTNPDWKAIGTSIVQGIKTGISKMWGNLKEWFKSLFGDLIGVAKKILGIASPSKVFKQFGLFIDKGLQGGLELGARDVLKTVEGLSNDVANSFNPDLTADYVVGYNKNGISNGLVGFGTANIHNTTPQKVEVDISIDDSISPLSFARYLLPYLKVAQKEAFA